MLIILEGVDGTYKSTVGRFLSSYSQKELYKGPPIRVYQGSSFESAQSNNKDLLKYYLDLISGGPSMILDRFIYSNLVYADQFKDYSILDPDQVKAIETICDTLYEEVILVYLYAEEKIIAERLADRGDDYIKKKDIGGLLKRYDRVIEDAGIRHNIRIDTSYRGSGEVTDSIIEYLKNHNIGRKLKIG